MTHYGRYGDSLEMGWLIGDVVAYWRCGGSLGMWWLIGVVVAHWICGGSLVALQTAGASVRDSNLTFPPFDLERCRIIVNTIKISVYRSILHPGKK